MAAASLCSSAAGEGSISGHKIALRVQAKSKGGNCATTGGLYGYEARIYDLEPGLYEVHVEHDGDFSDEYCEDNPDRCPRQWDAEVVVR